MQVRWCAPNLAGWRSNRAWAGGAVLDNAFAAAGMDTMAQDATLVSKKSWFLLDDSVVALGAGITSTDSRIIETTIENRNLHAEGTNALTIDGVRQPTVQGWSADRTARWAHLEGVGGYVFPGGTGIRANREERTGAWIDVETGTDPGSPDPITRRYLTMWLDHGTNPANARYAYILLPTASVRRTAEQSAQPQTIVVANSPTVQAIRNGRLGLIAANFWQAGVLGTPDGDITVDGPCSLLIRRIRSQLRVGISDPSRTAVQVRLEIPWPAKNLVDADPTVTYANRALTAATDGTHGHTQRATLAL